MDLKRVVPFHKFGKTKLVPHVTYTNGELDVPPRPYWSDVIWAETAECYYGLESYRGTGKTVLVVDRKDFLAAKEYTP